MNTDVTKAMSAKSDQWNAEDFLGGPKTIRITEVQVKSTAEQPVWISFENDEGRVWKPAKTVTRTLAAIWGADAARWVGLHCTIYCDPTITWAGLACGGIRISHMEGLTQPRTLMLSKAKGKRAATVIKPLEVTKAADKPPTVDRADLQRQSDAAKEMTPDAKKAWWAGLTKDEKAVVTELSRVGSAKDE